MSTDAPYFGIDFGTTYSSMAFHDPETGRAEVLRNDHDEEKTPSLVFFGEDDDILVGKDAADKIEEYESSTDPEKRNYVSQRLVRSIKRRRLNPPVIPIPGYGEVRPVEVVALILSKLKQDAKENHFYEEIKHVVLTYPAVFGGQQREVLREAAEMAGFKEVKFFEEPTAAAIAFARRGQKVGKGVLVYDLGAGTFDLAVVVRDEEDGTFDVAMEPEGDDGFGGDDLDQALYDYCDEVAREKLGRPINLTGGVDKFFLRHCRLRKESLSRTDRSKFSSYLPSGNGSQLFVHEVDRETFEGMIQGRIQGTVSKTLRLLEKARQRGHEVDTVVLIGGSSRIPLVERMLKKALEPVTPRKFAERAYAVALGAAYHAHDLWKLPDPRPAQYRKALKSCWKNGKLSRAEVEWLESLAKQELQLEPEVAAGIESEVMGDPIKDVLERQARVGRDRYGWVLMIGWRDKKLDVLQSIPADRLDMLLDNQDLFRERDFADSPVSARERNLIVGEMPWAVFVMAARVAADATLNPAAVADQLRALAGELGVSKEQAAEVEREVLGKTIKKFLDKQQAARRKYRKAVEEAYVDGQVSKGKANRLSASKDQLGLDDREATGIEREVLGDTVAAVLVEQDEVSRMAQRYKIARSQVRGTGKGGRVTRKDMEAAYAKEQKRKKQEREVPDLVGQSLEQARNNLNTASLELGDQTEAPNETVTEGTIISQHPAVGTRVKKGNTVSVMVSTGPSTVEVPYLGGLDRSEASSRLATAGLALGTRNEASSAEPEGRIIKQNPSARTQARRGSSVNITVSSGFQTAASWFSVAGTFSTTVSLLLISLSAFGVLDMMSMALVVLFFGGLILTAWAVVAAKPEDDQRVQWQLALVAIVLGCEAAFSTTVSLLLILLPAFGVLDMMWMALIVLFFGGLILAMVGFIYADELYS